MEKFYLFWCLNVYTYHKPVLVLQPAPSTVLCGDEGL